MNIEDIKVGETYNVRMKVTNKEKDMVEVKNPMVSVYGCDYMIISHKYIHEQPKYDPCRRFRKGDKVHVKREVHGRPVYIGEDAWEPLDPSEIWEVEEEKETGWVYLKNGCLSADVWHAMLELVAPVEELEPYSVVDAHTHWDVAADKGMKTVATYNKGYHPNAKAAAEAECARLNAEHRKEMER